MLIDDQKISELIAPYIINGVYDLLTLQKENPALFITQMLYYDHLWAQLY